MKAEIVLTVSEGKRLIAKGVAALGVVQEKMQQGVIVVTSGTTNGYVYEELLGCQVDKRAYLAGRTTPAKGPASWEVAALPDLVLVDGKPDPSLDRFTALEKMKQGDVYIKGANALNYAVGLAGITIGHPTGGTIGGSLGSIIGKKLHLLIPVGLEKEVPFDLQTAGDLLAEPDERIGHVHSLFPVSGHIFTELEALATLYGVEAYPVAAGGIAGAEGGLRLLLTGEAADVRQAVADVATIQGEPPVV
ncbi:MAG: hypothetical protein ACYC5M_18605 [Anaerolineae bacterium]